MHWNNDRRRNAITFTIPFFFLPEAFKFVISDELSDEKEARWLSMFKEFLPSLVNLSAQPSFRQSSRRTICLGGIHRTHRV
jgi:hypothetical protein